MPLTFSLTYLRLTFQLFKMESPANLDNDTGQGGMSSGSESSSRKRPQTVSCFLCGGTQIYPGPRYENHLINEHGVLDIDFMIAITLYKQKHGSNPSLENPIDSKEPSAISNYVKGKVEWLNTINHWSMKNCLQL